MIAVPPEWPWILLGLFVFWLLVDQGGRIYLMWAPWEEYKEDQTVTEEMSYAEEREAEAVELLSQSRIGRWFLKHRDKNK